MGYNLFSGVATPETAMGMTIRPGNDPRNIQNKRQIYSMKTARKIQKYVERKKMCLAVLCTWF